MAGLIHVLKHSASLHELVDRDVVVGTAARNAGQGYIILLRAISTTQEHEVILPNQNQVSILF